MCTFYIYDYSVWELAAIGRVLSSLSADFFPHTICHFLFVCLLLFSSFVMLCTFLNLLNSKFSEIFFFFCEMHVKAV